MTQALPAASLRQFAARWLPQRQLALDQAQDVIVCEVLLHHNGRTGPWIKLSDCGLAIAPGRAKT
jgi:hypothetical protein